eukprot:gene2038-18214_t
MHRYIRAQDFSWTKQSSNKRIWIHLNLLLISFLAAQLIIVDSLALGRGDNQFRLGPPATAGTFTGDGTFYGRTQGDGGNCLLYDPIPPPGTFLVAAINGQQWDNSAPCGACARVTGPSGTVTLRIVDQCPECLFGSVDLSTSAFELIAPLVLGRIAISWDFVRCDQSFVQGPVTLRWKEGSTQFWFAVQVRNHALPIAGFEVLQGGAYVGCDRQDYNYFVCPTNGETGQTFRITATDGQQIVEGPAVINVIYTGTQQF